jgi:enamine deaminase RidA (YjgF/YER057c/UK114 family)
MARRSIEVEDLSHGPNPIPAACRVGNVIMTGGIGGGDPSSGIVPDDARAQVAHAFANLRRVLAAAGATPDDVVKLAIAVRTFDVRAAINEEWVVMFPDAASRPARHVTRYDHLPGNLALQLEAYAVADGGAQP